MTIDKEKANNLLGINIEEFNFEKTTDKKSLSLEALMTTNNTVSEYDSFLKERNFTEILKNANSDFKKHFAKTLMSAESQVGEISLEAVENAKLIGMIRSGKSTKNLLAVLDFIGIQNSKIKPSAIIDIGIPFKPMTFNTVIEGKYKQTHTAFDTEADSEGHTILNTAINYEAKRVVVAYDNDKFKINYFEDIKGWDVIYLGTRNLWEAPLLADYESLIAATLTSALEQGSIETLSLYKKIFPMKIPINLQLLAEYLNNQRKGIWLCHNNFYDINQLNALYKYKKGKRQKWNIIKTKPVEFIQIRYANHDLYKVKLGNTTVGFRFNSNSNTRFSFRGIPQITVAPSQARSFSFVNCVDTINLGFAGRFPSLKLSNLSKGLGYEKIDLKEEKIFSKNDLIFTDEMKISDKLRYNMVDCLATLSVYSMLSYHFNLEEIGKLLDVDLTITKDWHRPFSCSILSPASVAKFVLSLYLEKQTKLDKHVIESNLDLSRQYLLNFKKTYLGGRTEAFVFGKVLPTADKTLKYLDFEAQYPNASRLIQAELQLILAAGGTIQEYLQYNSKETEVDFWKTVETCIDYKKKGIPLPASFAEKILGNITFTFQKFSLNLRTRLAKRLQDVKVASRPKDPHRITVSMFDLLASIEFSVLVDRTPLQYIKDNLEILHTERLLFDEKTPEFGDDLFSKLLKLRRKFKKQLKKADNEAVITRLTATEQNLKYLMNSGYGLTVEGISKDYVGKLQVLSIGCLITACARYLNYSAEMLYRINKGTPIYSDTDSIQALASETTHKKVCDWFTHTIPLKEEKEYGTEIKGIIVLGKKKYGIMDQDGNITCKTHGSAGYDDITPIYQKMYDLMFTTSLKPKEISRQVVKNHPIYQKISYRKEKDSKIIGIKLILNKGRVVRKFTQGELTLYIYKYEELDKNKNQVFCDYLIINTKSISKGTFGSYLNVKKDSKSKVIWSIFAPCNFDKIVQQTFTDYPEILTTQKRISKASERIDNLYYALEPLFGELSPEFMIDPFTDQAIMSMEQFDTYNETFPRLEHVFKDPSNPRSQFRGTKKLTDVLQSTLESLSSTSVDPAKPNWNRIYEGILENGITDDEFLETFESKAGLGDVLTAHHFMIKLYGDERKDSMLLSEVQNKKKLLRKFENLIQFSEQRFHRKRVDIGKSYSIMKQKIYKSKINCDIIKEYRNNDKFDCDGFTYAYSVNLPALDFSAKLKSDETKYYSQAIINVGLTASMIWNKTHYKTVSKIIEKNEELLHLDPKNLPCPKTDKNILIPLKVVPKIDPNESHIPIKLYNLVFDKAVRIFLSQNKVVTHSKRTHKQDYVIVRKPKQYQKELRKLYKHQWIVIDWMNQKWSVSIEKRQSLDYNAMLSLKILLNTSELGKRTFQCGLRLNPSSKNLYNIDLFETSVKELDDASYIGKILAEKLFQQSLLTYFGKKRATHIEDLNASEEPYEAYNITYLTLAAQILKRRVRKLRAKLGIVAYTKNIRTLNPTKELIPVLNAIFRERVQKLYDKIENPAEQLLKMEDINVSTNRFSLGFNINNYDHKYTISIYGKDYYQYLSKLKRISKHEKMRDLPTVAIAKIKHFRELLEIEEDKHTLRIEITIRGWEQIHTRAFYKYLDKIHKIILAVDRELLKKGASGKSHTEYIKKIKRKATIKLDLLEATFERELDEIQFPTTPIHDIGGLDPPLIS